MGNKYYPSHIPLSMLPYCSTGALLTYGQLFALHKLYGLVTISNATLGARLHCHPRSIRRYLSELSNQGFIQVHTETRHRKTKRTIELFAGSDKFIIIPKNVMKIDNKALPYRAKILYGLLDRQVRIQAKVARDEHGDHEYDCGMEVEAIIDSKDVWAERPEDVTTTEVELAKTMGTSPRTVQRALDQLKKQDLISNIIVDEGVNITIVVSGTDYTSILDS